eukprot:486757-Pyramimonas_sp.AAC.1
MEGDMGGAAKNEINAYILNCQPKGDFTESEIDNSDVAEAVSSIRLESCIDAQKTKAILGKPSREGRALIMK